MTKAGRSDPMMEPRNLKRWLILIAILYLVFPRDLIPDFLGGGLGFIDDLLLIGTLTYFYRKRLREHSDRAAYGSAGQDPRESSGHTKAPEGSLDPYQILSINPSASEKEIQSAYKARMHEYHPDKVAHLGEELQKVAHRKSIEIQRAYDQLRK